MKQRIEELLQEIQELKAQKLQDIEEYRIRLLGKKGAITKLFEDFREVLPEQKRELGQKLNSLKNMAASKLEELKEKVEDAVQQNAPISSNKHSASLITGWHNFSSLHISDNVVLKGSVTANNSTNSHRIAEGSGTRENNYACEKVTVNGEQRNGGNSYYEGISRTREELGEKSFYETLGFNFTEAGAWEWDSEQGAPVVKDSTFEIPENKPALTVDQEGYYLIREAADFLEIRKDPEGKYRLANDLKVSAGEIDYVPAFSGEFDGQSHTISGYESEHPLFMELRTGAVVRNLSMVNADVETGDSYGAILAGVCDGAVISHVSVQGRVRNTSGNTGDNTGTGGIAGSLRSTEKEFLVENCNAQVEASATGYIVGAVFGQVAAGGESGEIRACYGSGSVSGNSFVGGLGGRVMDTSSVWIRNCVSTSQVAGSVHVGGLMGMAKCGVEHCLVAGVNISQKDSNTTDSKYAASFLTGWHNYSGLGISNNVIHSGAITTTQEGRSYNIADGSGTRRNNYVSEGLTINGSFRDTGNESKDGIKASAAQLASQSYPAARQSSDPLGRSGGVRSA